jgi:hypothetical protein
VGYVQALLAFHRMDHGHRRWRAVADLLIAIFCPAETLLRADEANRWTGIETVIEVAPLPTTTPSRPFIARWW